MINILIQSASKSVWYLIDTKYTPDQDLVRFQQADFKPWQSRSWSVKNFNFGYRLVLVLGYYYQNLGFKRKTETEIINYSFVEEVIEVDELDEGSC